MGYSPWGPKESYTTEHVTHEYSSVINAKTLYYTIKGETDHQPRLDA